MRKSEAYNIISEFSEKIDDPDNFEYNDVIAVFNKTVDALKEYPDLHKYIDADFMRSLHTNYVKDLYLEYSRVFMQIMKSKNTEEQKKYLRELEGVDKKLSKDLENYAVENNLELIDITFAKRLKMLYASTGPNENSDIMNLVLNAPTAEKCEQMLECVFDDKVPVVCRNKNLLFIDNVYRQHPELTDKVFEIIKKNKDSKCFFAVLADIAVFDENKAEEALCCMHARVQEGPVDEFLLQKYYDKMKAVCDKLPKFKHLAQEFCREALCLPQNNKNCKKLAARLLEDEQSLYSQVSIGEKTEKSTSNPFGYHKVERIGADEVCVLFIGGNGTRDDKAAHGYIKPAVELLKEYDLDKSVSVYGTTYDFGDYFNTDQALDAQMQKYGHKSRFVDGVFESVHDETKNPQFIKQIFDMFILPRISRLNGKIRLPAEEAAKKNE